MAIAYLTDYMLGRDLYCHWLFVLSTTRALIQLSWKDIWARVFLQWYMMTELLTKILHSCVNVIRISNSDRQFMIKFLNWR